MAAERRAGRLPHFYERKCDAMSSDDTPLSYDGTRVEKLLCQLRKSRAAVDLRYILM